MLSLSRQAIHGRPNPRGRTRLYVPGTGQPQVVPRHYGKRIGILHIFGCGRLIRPLSVQEKRALFTNAPIGLNIVHIISSF